MSGNYNDYRLGFTNIKEEITSPVTLEVEGTFPRWLRGSLFRNGPGIFEIPRKNGEGSVKINHWFDGLTVIHKFSIEENGVVTFRNRNVSKDIQEEISSLGRNFGMSFGTDPCKTLFRKFFTLFEMERKSPEGRSLTNIGVTLGEFNGEFWSKTDANVLLKFDPENLEKENIFSYETLFPPLKGPLSAAHSHYDAETKELFNFVCDLGSSGHYKVFSLRESQESQGKVEGKVLAEFGADPTYIHSFALTQNYFILIMWPLVLNPLGMVWDKSVEGAMSWKPSKGTTFHVIDRVNGGVKAIYTADPFFCFHNINAFEENGNIVIDLTAYSDASLIHSLNLNTLLERPEGGKHGKVKRFILENVSSASLSSPLEVKEITLCSHTLELPRFNQKYHMKPYQFTYGIGFKSQKLIWDSLLKLNNETGKTTFWEEKGCYPGEPIFVPTPEGTEEDDGVILSVVLSSEEQKSFLLVLDAKDMTELGRAWAPQCVPFGFHGNYFPSSGDRVDQ